MLVLTACSLHVLAQHSSVTVIVVDEKKLPIPFATVRASLPSDSTKSTQKITDSSGVAVLQLTPGSSYLFKISSVGYTQTEKNVMVTGNNIFTVTARAEAKAVGSVTVTATKPIMRQEDDKTIVDPENLAASSTNAFEILEKIPGLYVDQDGNVYLSSITPAKIYINGREQRMSTTDIATMLKSLPPGSILHVEILRTPSAKYDASGGGGIVNVVLKKGVRIGLTGSLNTGFNQGVYGNQFAGISLNNSAGKLNSYINVQTSRRNSYDQIKTDRLFAADSILKQDAYTRYPGNTFYVGGGFGYELSKKWEVTYDGRISLSNSKNNTVNGSEISKISSKEVVTSNIANVQTEANSSSLSQSISTKFKIDSAGSEWTNDLSYTANPNTSSQNFNTGFIIPSRSPSAGNGDVNTKFNFLSLASNVLFKLPKKIVVETGFKSTLIGFKNNAEYFRKVNGSSVVDNFRTAGFRYSENINSGYFQASKNIKGIIIKAGVRAENTNMEGKQLVPKDTSFNIHRTDLFPYVYVSRNLMTIMGYELKGYLVYRRTISRPSYDLLNPFPRYIDPYLFETGNPALRPQFTQNYEANISVNERPIFALGVNNTKDILRM
ncbi:outer membrane beta-barrel protein [Segetibacter aerophilus]|uniref:Outer membrane protein beta-barrel domain-containing protein n=1 Tax=Segetibacter aerophilus TaxID=670293 RepID=A0A512B741_9BACT|nr:outer membrane beta-barrel protein [Segetibacter aerophilus]GEO07774.1 hypothetical protein SAE01_02700 [Segetibacter aerophilus]